MEEITKHKIIDEVEGLLSNYPPIECPVIHRFIPGMYIREIYMPAGTFCTSKIHKFEHPFVVSKGKVSVWIDGEIQVIEAPYWGITKPGTRRILFVQEDCIWTTFHVNPDDCKDVLEIENRIIEPHDNPLLSEEIKLKNNLNQKKCHLSELPQE
jgi:hypothetical protein